MGVEEVDEHRQQTNPGECRQPKGGEDPKAYMRGLDTLDPAARY